MNALFAPFESELNHKGMVNYEVDMSHAILLEHQSSPTRTQTERLSDTLSRISWLLPELLLVTGLEALPQPSLQRRPVSGLCLMVESFATTLAVVAAFWPGWVLRW